jgi:hypothetical protein
LDADPNPSFFSLIFCTFYILDQIKAQNFSYFLVTQEKININLFLVVFPYLVQFRFAAKYKSGLKLNLDMNPDLEGPAALEVESCTERR